ncbi:TPA: 30S ribosomal protein S8 [Candidatus Woesearchaeota archaeon]|nr:30S ribosomal protein S8 [uncultured archaeon]HIG98064.1 30S ribosomal protein S8 [Candidatus Woesearchaeota archaeon]
MLNDPLANVLSVVNNAEAKGFKECSIKPSSSLIRAVLDILGSHGYIGTYVVSEDGRGGLLQITLIGAINRCGAIKPRFSTGVESYEKFEKKFLPAKDFGVLIVSTQKGVMTHTEAKAKGLGGRLLAYCY